MGKLRNRMKKQAVNLGSYNLKVYCVQAILEENNITLQDMAASDVVDYLEMNDVLDFDNISDLVEEWIEETRENYPEYIK